MAVTILAISEKPGLYKLISRSKNRLIVESLDSSHKRLPAFPTDRITSLADISMYSNSDDVPLYKVLSSIKELEEGKQSSINYKKASNNELEDYLGKVFPDYDRERVHISDIKKLIQWYNILISNGISDFEADLAPTRGDNVDDRKDEPEG